MANRYWVGNGGNWSDNTNHWSASSNGSPGATLPGDADFCIFDQYSFTSTGQTVVFDVEDGFAGMSWASVTNNPTFRLDQAIYLCRGDITFAAPGSMTFNPNGKVIYFYTATTGTCNITSNGQTLYGLAPYGANCTVKLLDACVCTFIELYRGVFDTNGQTLTVGYLYGANTEAITLTITGSTINFNSNTSSYGLNLTDTSLTVNATGSTINFSGNNNMLVAGSGGHTFNIVNVSGTPFSFYGSNTFAEINISAGKSVKFESGKTTTITSDCTADGTAAAISISSTTADSVATISKASGTVEVKNCDLVDITASGGADFYASTDSSLDNSSGWTLGSPPSALTLVVVQDGTHFDLSWS